MRRYETIVILDPDLSEENRTAFTERVKEIIAKFQGVLLKEDIWGNRRLAYEVNKKPRGFYIRYDYCGLGALVDELERSFRIDDRAMRYLTVVLDKDADVQKLVAEFQSSQQPDEQEEAAGKQPATESPAQQASEEAEPSATVNGEETPAEAVEDTPASRNETAKEEE